MPPNFDLPTPTSPFLAELLEALRARRRSLCHQGLAELHIQQLPNEWLSVKFRRRYGWTSGLAFGIDGEGWAALYLWHQATRRSRRDHLRLEDLRLRCAGARIVAALEETDSALYCFARGELEVQQLREIWEPLSLRVV